MASLEAIVDREPPSEGKTTSPASTPPSLRRDKTGLPTASSYPPTLKRGPPPDALSLLKSRPGLDGTPLGSPTIVLAPPGTGGISLAESDPVIANAFHGLKPLPQESALTGPVPHKVGGSGKGRAKTASAAARSARRVTAGAVKKGSPAGSTAAGSGAAARAGFGARPSTAGAARSAGGGTFMLSRTGKELVCTGQVGRVGVRGGEGDGEGGGGALGARLLGSH